MLRLTLALLAGCIFTATHFHLIAAVELHPPIVSGCREANCPATAPDNLASDDIISGHEHDHGEHDMGAHHSFIIQKDFINATAAAAFVHGGGEGIHGGEGGRWAFFWGGSGLFGGKVVWREKEVGRQEFFGGLGGCPPNHRKRVGAGIPLVASATIFRKATFLISLPFGWVWCPCWPMGSGILGA